MRDLFGPQQSNPTPQGRRSSPRVHVDGRVLARLMTLDVPVEMRDVSFGGFQLASAVPVEVGDVHEVRAVTVTGLVYTLHARVVRCEPPPTGTGRLFISGWEIAPDQASAVALAAIVDSLTEQLQFKSDTD